MPPHTPHDFESPSVATVCESVLPATHKNVRGGPLEQVRGEKRYR